MNVGAARFELGISQESLSDVTIVDERGPQSINISDILYGEHHQTYA